MFVLFIFLGFKLHTNYDLRVQQKIKGIQEVNQVQNKLNSKFHNIDLKDIPQITNPRFNCHDPNLQTMSFNNNENFNNPENNLNKESFISCINDNFDSTLISITGSRIANVLSTSYLDALIVFKNANLNCSLVNVFRSGTMNDNAQIFHFDGSGNHAFAPITFKWCGMNLDNFQGGFGPSLVLIEGGESTNTMSEPTFIHPNGNDEKLSDQYINRIYPCRCVRVKDACSLSIIKGRFYNATAENRGAFLRLESTKDIFISQIQFGACEDKDAAHQAHAIAVHDTTRGTVTIEKCTFLDCGTNENGFLILSDVSGFYFNDNTITFTDPNRACSCIRCYRTGTYSFVGNTFTNANTHNSDVSAGIQVDGVLDGYFTDELFILDGNTFDHIAGSSQGRCLSVKVKKSGLTQLSNNIIRNCPSGNFNIKIWNAELITNFTISGWKFINNVVSQGHGGGSGIWIENHNSQPFALVVENCLFENNLCEECGGGFQIGANDDGDDQYQIHVEVSIKGCNFTANRANRFGGALSVGTSLPLIIESCSFTNNKCENNGGAIFIRTVSSGQNNANNQMPNATITGCTFNGNSGMDAHCIYIQDAPNTPVDISTCKFSNNFNKNQLRGACILSNAISLTVTNCNFINDNNAEFSCGGINVTSRSTLIVSKCQFVRCTAGTVERSYGGGIGYSTIVNDEQSRTEYISIQECDFDDNAGANGVAMGLKPHFKPEISYVTIKNHVLTNWIFFIFFQEETEGDFTLTRVDFLHNSYDSAHGQEFGGGSGIWIAESEDINYVNAFNLVFDQCNFENNHSPENGGALSYGGSPRLESIELTFRTCRFEHNSCEHYYGGACRFETSEPVSLYDCTFNDNSAPLESETGGSGGGAIFIGSTVKSVIINNCDFRDCFAQRGSFIFTNGAMKDMNISACTFTELTGDHKNSVYVQVDTQVTQFFFDSNEFNGLRCKGQDGGAGLHITTGSDCVVSNCKFINCDGNGDDSGMIRIPENSNSELIFNFCQFNVSSDSTIGSRALYVVRESLVRFNSCSFEINNGELVGAVIKSKAQTSTIFYNCSFVSLTAMSLMALDEALFVDISDSQFSNCQMYDTLITAPKAQNYTVSHCSFINVIPMGATKGTIHFGTQVENGLICNNTFRQCLSNLNINGAAVHVDGQNLQCNIHNNTFRGCGSVGNGLALYIANGELVDIQNCDFIDNSPNTDPLGSKLYTIYSNSKELIFSNSKIENTEQNKYGSGLAIIRECHITITSVIFRNIHRPSAIEYSIQLNQPSENEYESVIENCTFDSISMLGSALSNSYSVFNFGSNLEIQFRNNTIQNHKLPSSSWNNLRIGKIYDPIIDCYFINNEANGYTGGGCGIELTNNNAQIRNSFFSRNHANATITVFQEQTGKGGAIQFGGSGSSASIEIDECVFENNRADYEGGALSIQCLSAVITNSVFTSNIAARYNFGSEGSYDKMGGAIYFERPQQSDKNYVLSNCTFKENNADVNGHAICIKSANTRLEVLGDCLFEDNYRNDGSQIAIIGGATLDFSNSSVRLERATTKTRGIELIDGYLEVHETIFSHIEASQRSGKSEGNAILVNSGNTHALIENNSFIDCYMDNRLSYAVTCNGSDFTFQNNVFNFTASKGCGCLRIYSVGQILIENNRFLNVITDGTSGFSGAFYFNEMTRASNSRMSINNNIFEQCSSFSIACFTFATSSNDIAFTENYFQNNNLKNYLGSFDFLGEKVYGEFTLDKNYFINNTARSDYGGGSGLWFQNKPSANDIKIENHYTLFIDGCQFIGNHAVYTGSTNRNDHDGTGGGFQMGWSESEANVDVVLINTTFENNKADIEGGALSLQIIGYTKISNCTFKGNNAGENINQNYNQNVGGAIYIWPDYPWKNKNYDGYYSDNVTISDTLFIDNQAADATAVYMKSAQNTKLIIDGNTRFIDNRNNNYRNFTVVSEFKEFLFEDSKIEFTDLQQSTGGIRTTSLTTINRCHFVKNFGNDVDLGNVLHVEESVPQISIHGSVFENCGITSQLNYNSVILFTPKAIIQNNVFNFTSNTQACRPVFVKRYCDILFVENNITSSHSNGALYYAPIIGRGNVQNENVVIEKCIFDKCQGSNSRALYVELATTNASFRNNTIQNCPLNTYLFVFSLLATQEEFVVDNIIFRNLQTQSAFGGGSGSWVQKRNGYFNLIYRDCTFENNHAYYSGENKGCPNGRGGAVQYGWSKSISDCGILFENCIFDRNVADREGGALCIMIQGNTEIVQCTFTNNRAGATTTGDYYGGAIAIFPSYKYENHKYAESITISGCTFSENTGHNANAIFIQDASNTDVFINENCQFIDNLNKTSTQFTVLVDGRRLEMDNCNFEFTSVSRSCNAVRTNATTFQLSNSFFTRCNLPSGKGSAVNIQSSADNSIITNCKFIDNGDNMRGSVIYSEAHSLEFQSNLIDFTNMTSSSDRGIYIPFISRFYLIDSEFRHCLIKEGGTGAAFDYKGDRKSGYSEDILIDNCTFDNNSCTYASCFLMWPTTLPVLRNIVVRNHKDVGNFVTVIIFKNNLRDDILLEKWTLDNNLYNRSSEQIPDCGGSGLWVACSKEAAGYRDSYRIIFDTCTFKRNTNNLYGGALAYGNSPTLRYIFLNFNDCLFENNLCEGEKGGALFFNASVPVTIERTEFRGNKVASENYKGHCIYVDKRCKCLISDSTFIDNGIFNHSYPEWRQKESGFSIIQCSGAQLELNRCLMTFTDPSVINGRCIDIDYYSVVNLINSTFSNVNAGNLWGGAIHLNKTVTSIIDERITIDSCVFENNDAANGCSALLNASAVPTLINLTFKNQSNSKYIFAVFFVAFKDECTVENTVFENCTSAKEDGGGSAVWIANQEEISHGRPFELTFYNCTWRGNVANERGGAIHYGNSKTLIGLQMTFDKCHFEANHAKKEGGAVSLITKSPIVFNECVFRSNYVEAPKTRASTDGTKGGSISVNSKTPLVQISRCSFTNETSEFGNAIFIHDQVQACLISECSFKNCGRTGSVIVSETMELMLSRSEITFDRRLQACRGLEIKTISVTSISRTIFRNCHTTEIGAGIYLNNTLLSEEQEDCTIDACTFDACEAELNGCAFFLNVSSVPVIRGLTIQNHRFDRNISVILNYNDFQDLYTIQSCTFLNNQFQNTLQQDGGGSGIFIANQKQSEFESTYKLSFIDCSWTKNTAAYGGALSYGNNNLVHKTELVFERCTFSENMATNHQGGALYINTNQLILLDGCTFNKNRCHNPSAQALGGALYVADSSSVTVTGSTFVENYASDGNAIYIHDIQSSEITGCTFTSNNNGKQGSQITTRCAELNVRDTDLKFNANKATCRGIEVLKKCASTFINCNFLSCNITGNGGGLRIEEDMVTNRTESLTIEGCLFDKCDSDNGAAVFASISCNPTIRKNTVSNCNRGNYIFTVFFYSVPTVPRFVTVDECTFEGNYFKGASTSDAGGIGLWIAYKKELSSEQLSLAFNKCNFISNGCGMNGGAFAYGESQTLKNISLQFTECTFRENTCNQGLGGALYISTEKPLTITKCDFINNRCNGANTKGSAIYINSPSDLVQIRESTFEGGQSIDGVGICAGSRTTNVAISSCSFTNCGSSSTGSVIQSEAAIFSLQYCNVTFDLERDVKCRAVKLINKAAATFSNDQFINCQSSGEGGGLSIDFTSGGNEESLLIKDSTFINADASNGCAMLIRTAVEPTLDGITIRNCTSGHYIFVIFFTAFVYEAKVSRSSFEYNKFANNAYPPLPDSGGSGIWIANNQRLGDSRDKRLVFEECTWLGNSLLDKSSLKYGGAFAYGTSATLTQTELEFTSCRFIQNVAQERGGALYLCTSLPVTISRCLFDGNEADEGAAIYTTTGSNVTIEYSQIVRSKVGQNAALFIKSTEVLGMTNVTFTENVGSAVTTLYLENEGSATIENCNFDYTRNADQHQIRLAGESSSATITFLMGCFIHSGEDGGNSHIYSTFKGTINLPAGNCFDSPQNVAINNKGGSISTGSGIFDCHKCGSIYVPTIAPEPTPSASPSQSVEVTTNPPNTPTDAPTTPPITVSSSSSDKPSQPSGPGSSSSSSKSKKIKTIAMIAGITAAIVIVIVVIIILLWCFIFRKRSPRGENNSDNASEMNDEQITEISGIDPGADDPIWAGTNQDNPLFNGGDDQDEDQMIHNDFEESWGDNVI